jgi:hypothetical protein
VVTYTIWTRTPESALKMATVHIEGDVTFTEWGSLEKLCLDTIRNCDHLVLNLDGIGEYDYSFGVFVCLLRRTLSLLKMQLTIQGEQHDAFINLTSRCWNPGTDSAGLLELAAAGPVQGPYLEEIRVAKKLAAQHGGDAKNLQQRHADEVVGNWSG